MLPFHLIVLHLSLSCLYCVLLLFCILFLCFDPHTPSPSALIPFLLFSLLPCPSSPLSLLILFISADFTNYKVTEEFPFYLFVHPKGLSKSSAVCLHHSLLVSTAQGVYLCIHTLKDFQIALIRLSSTNKKIGCSWS